MMSLMQIVVYVCIVFNQKTADVMRMSDWISAVCSSDLAFACSTSLVSEHPAVGIAAPNRDDILAWLQRNVGHGARCRIALIDRSFDERVDLNGVHEALRCRFDCGGAVRNGDLAD